MKKIIAILTTKNRIDFFKNSSNSIHNQTKKPDITIVISDSNNENKIQEKEICKEYDFIFLENSNEKNYAGSLNTAIKYIIENEIIKNNQDPREIFIASLDDDDYWEQDYLKYCKNLIHEDTDFIVSGLKYKKINETINLKIPEKLTLDDFLKTNPHIQGSNTFVKLSTLMLAGCFDENMSATTDRDIFTRIMMLKPKYEILNEYLVNINAEEDRDRITTDKNDNKLKSYALFFAKYGGLMSKDISNSFFERSNNLFKISEEEIKNYLLKNINNNTLIKNNEDNHIKNELSLLFSFISDDEEKAKKMIDNINNYEYKNKKLICFLNYSSANDYCIIKELIANKFTNYKIITLFDIKKYMTKKEFQLEISLNNYFSKEEILNEKGIRNISLARIVLNYFTYKYSNQNDVIWILDDDMDFFEFKFINNKFEKVKLDINSIISKYYKKYDVVIGNYSNDPALPTLSIIRSSLLDYTYSKKLSKNQIYDYSIYSKQDYYYDLSNNNLCFETPLPIISNSNIKDIFSGKAISRFLFNNNLKEFEPISRGGNTLIFNRETLKIPNISIKINDLIARRSDFFWVLLLKEKQFKIIGSSFSTFHNRKVIDFNYEDEVKKELKDLIGSSFTKAYKEYIDNNKNSFYYYFKKYYTSRLAKFILNYYRIIGLLKINEENDYLNKFNEINLFDYIHNAKKYLDESLINTSFRVLKSAIKMNENFLERNNYLKIINSKFPMAKLKLLGVGNEAIIFNDDNLVYKLFYSKQDELKKLNEYKDIFKRSNNLEEINLLELENNYLITYKYYRNYKNYEQGYLEQLSDLIIFLRRNNLVLTNLKKENFIVANNCLKYIDYGKNIESFSKQKYVKSIERAFQVIKYHNLSEFQFKQIISKSHLNELPNALNYGLEQFQTILKKRTKEEIHDSVVYKIVEKFNPINFLDYGAGKCKIANTLSNKDINVFVYDIDKDTIKNRANKNVNVIDDINKLNKEYDFINCNKVLCCTDKKTNKLILKDISRLISDDGIILFSICNPFFDNVQRTELTLENYKGEYLDCKTYNKKTIFKDIPREEYHKPFIYYKRLLEQNGFKILNIEEDNGVNFDSLNKISEHLFIICKKEKKNYLKDCSLLIKVNSMEHEETFNNITQIVDQLEKKDIFAKRFVVVDVNCDDRKNRYNNDDESILIEKLNILKNVGYIDEILLAKNSKPEEIYKKYFKQYTKELHSLNGQNIFSTLVGFNSIKTRYVFQTDSDILYFNNGNENLKQVLDTLKNEGSLSINLSIASLDNAKYIFNERLEVRNSIVDLFLLNKYLPLSNNLKNDRYSLTWNRCVDRIKLNNKNIRLKSKNLFFIHPQNNLKKENNLINIVRDSVIQSFVPNDQYENVDLMTNIKEYVNKIQSHMIVYVRGFNTSIEKLKRLFDYFKKQTYQNFKIVYIDDGSNYIFQEYAKTIFNYNSYFKNKVYAIFNTKQVGEIKNFKLFINEIATNPYSIVVNVDSDDFLINENALEIINKEFENGADVTVGNCFNVNKPLTYYNISNFNNIWERNGDNIWLHPKAFKRYLCNWIQDDDLKINNKYVTKCTDFAIMLPIICNAQKPVFINQILYYYEPSSSISNEVTELRNKLLNNYKHKKSKKIIAVIGNGNLKEDSKEYQTAFLLGKSLIDNGYRIQTGGLFGIMEAVSKGAKESKNYELGDTIAFTPFEDTNKVNEYVDVVIPTGLDILRNKLVVDADAVICIGGGSGTLSEIALAWQIFKLIIAFTNVDGWSFKLANKPIDDRKRYSNISNDIVIGVSTIEQAIKELKKNINNYIRKHSNIKWGK